MKKKVALISPGKDWRFVLSEPLNIGFIASYLEKKKIDVKIIDQVAGYNVEKEIDEFSPDIVGITATTTSVLEAYEIAEICKEKGIRTVMGGVHASVLPEEALEHVDIVVKGEGEKAIFDIVKNDVKSGVISKNYIKNLDEIPLPKRVEKDMDFYSKALQRNFLHFVSPKTKCASLITSRGCPYNCIFCHNTWRGIPFRFNTTKRVEEELKFLVERGVSAVFFIDDNLFVNKPRLAEICKITKKLDLIWSCNSRVDNVDSKSLEMVKDAGCEELNFGFETGSQRILDILNKGTTIEQNRNAARMCNKIGIKVSGAFMIGSPTETLEDIEMTRKFVEENDFGKLGFCITTPFPGTKLWKWCEEEGRIPENLKWSDFTYIKIPINCSDIPTEKLQKTFDDLAAMVLMDKKPISELLIRALKFPDKTIKHLPIIVKTSIKRIRRILHSQRYGKAS